MLRPAILGFIGLPQIGTAAESSFDADANARRFEISRSR
jgi:hypothetical protein